MTRFSPKTTFALWLHRTFIEFSGQDRATFLHNLCTNDIKQLSPGQACEAFITNVQGKTIGHGLVYCGVSSLVFETAAGHGAALMQHFDKYLIREDVTLRDRTDEWGQIVVVGASAKAQLQSVFGDVPASPTGHKSIVKNGIHLTLAAYPVLGPTGFAIRTQRQDSDAVACFLHEAGVTQVDIDSMEVVRVEYGWPIFGVDLDANNLPQEIDRDSTAISFRKGCYLGQETVARIDALGHVNKKLVSIEVHHPAAVPTDSEIFAATELTKPIGKVTSSAWSDARETAVSLGYVKTQFSGPDTELMVGVDGQNRRAIVRKKILSA